MLRDHGVVLAIETHFEFTSFELLRLFDMCEAEPGDWLGICLDTMNLLTMIEDPVMATERLLPWVVSTHIKDGGVLVDAGGPDDVPRADRRRASSTWPPSSGGSTRSPRPVHLSVEDHGGSFLLPIHDAALPGEVPGPDRRGAARDVIEIAQATRPAPACRPLDRDDWPAVCEERLAARPRRLARDRAAGPAMSREMSS